MSKKLLLALTVAQICHGQLTESVYPMKILKDTPELSEKITSDPDKNSTTKLYSDGTVVNSVFGVPDAVANYLGPVKLHVPTSNTNNVAIINQFVNDFNEGSKNEDAHLRIDALLIKYGFPVEIYEVKTKDGYLLTMFRIPSNGPTVFLMHGLLGCAVDFVLAGRNSGLAYLLADAGYDVWIGNARGNTYSRRHTVLDSSKASFWDFSWHEIGVYDLPAMIDFALNATNKETLKYIGFSQGTTSFFVMTSEIPEYNKKVSLMIALAPVAYTTNLRSPVIRLVTPGISILEPFAKSVGIYEFIPEKNLIWTFRNFLCGAGVVAEILCSNAVFLITGFDNAQLNVTNLSVILGHIPAGASVKQLFHYAQGILGKDFRKFDYGSKENLRRYGMKVPPRYALNNVVVNVSLFYAEEDWLAHPIDVERLHKRLSNVVDMYKIPYQHFSHVDFYLAKDVKKLIYNRVLNVLAKF